MVKQELFNIPELDLDKALDNKQNRLLSRSYEVSAVYYRNKEDNTISPRTDRLQRPETLPKHKQLCRVRKGNSREFRPTLRILKMNCENTLCHYF